MMERIQATYSDIERVVYTVGEGNPQTIDYIYRMALGDFLPTAALRYDLRKLAEILNK